MLTQTSSILIWFGIQKTNKNKIHVKTLSHQLQDHLQRVLRELSSQINISQSGN